MFIKGTFAEKNAILNTAEKMCAAAKTAPKTKGLDKIRTAILTGDEKDALSQMMKKIGEMHSIDFFIRDSKNVSNSEAVVLIGIASGARGVPFCSFCGHEDCSAMQESGGHCAYDDIDLGIAIGSAAAIAADNRIDNRVMFSAGKAAMQVNLLGDDIAKILGISLSTTGKSIYFDRT